MQAPHIHALLAPSSSTTATTFSRQFSTLNKDEENGGGAASQFDISGPRVATQPQIKNLAVEKIPLNTNTFLEKDARVLYKNLMDLTKFKLSLLNSIGAYSMFYYFAPLQGVGLLSSATFLLGTQAIAMSSQVFGQVAEAYQDSRMKRTQQRPMVQNKFTSK